MPNVLNENGLTISSLDEIQSGLITRLRAIYGADINTDSDTADGQWIGNLSQQQLDMLNLTMSVYNSFDPDKAVGVVLDQRVAINGIQRSGGTFTVTPITVVTNQSVNLYGLDQEIEEVYTISDSAGNLWQLMETELGLPSGTNILSFQAAVPGAQLTIPNTINVQVTIVLGVVSVNNPTTYSVLGINEESDAVLRLRRQQSVSLASQGYYQGLLAALLNINGVTSAYIYENDTDVTDSDGVPSHSIWVIVSSNGLVNEEIARAIYVKRNAGAGMKGDIEWPILQIDGSIFPVRWDTVTYINLFISFTATSLNGVTPPNIQAIVDGLPLNFVPGVNSEVNVNGLATAVQQIDPNTLVTNAGFTDGRTQTMTLSDVATAGTFKIDYAGNQSALINWNDPIGSIQSKVQAIPGMASVTVAGSIASKTLIFSFPDGNVDALLFVTQNTLVNAGAVPIVFGYGAPYFNTLDPLSKKYQFIVSAENIYILPMTLMPATANVPHDTTLTFTGAGGYGDLVYSLSVNNSGGSIDPVSGLYTAGGVVSVTDTIKVTDKLGNSMTASAIVN